MEHFKPFIKLLITYYYNVLENHAGGNYHIVLDDGNIEHSNIEWCQDKCQQEGDSFGLFLGDILLMYSEDELWDMYNDNWWGME